MSSLRSYREQPREVALPWKREIEPMDGFSENVSVSRIATSAKPDAVRFTTQGRVVIPAWLCRESGIRGRTRVVVWVTPQMSDLRE